LELGNARTKKNKSMAGDLLFLALGGGEGDPLFVPLDFPYLEQSRTKNVLTLFVKGASTGGSKDGWASHKEVTHGVRPKGIVIRLVKGIGNGVHRKDIVEGLGKPMDRELDTWGLAKGVNDKARRVPVGTGESLGFAQGGFNEPREGSIHDKDVARRRKNKTRAIGSIRKGRVKQESCLCCGKSLHVLGHLENQTTNTEQQP
jgi:hypothetical protein